MSARTLHLSAPLPFEGQKRMLAKPFSDIVRQYPAGTVFVDLFGGSGLLSHITKYYRPESKVVYNDYDNYRQRIDNIPYTNRLLSLIRSMVATCPRHKMITGDVRQDILDLLEQEELDRRYVDYITLSSSLLFSGKYRLSLEAFKRETWYNNVRRNNYTHCPEYLAGLEIVSCDYRELFEMYKDTPGVVFLIDPPYLSTDVGTYNMTWRLSDYLDVLTILNGHNFVYFTSDKSGIVELCEWIGSHKSLGNPFARCTKREVNARLNYNAGYTDMMLFTPPGNDEL
ncbi:MAG: DNA adenine methylase [Bacteroides sp.]|nr:DNA adenine methylase [Bacteroides sp.]